MLKYGITPNILCSGHKILQLTLPEFGQTYIDSFKYVKTSLGKAAKTFGLELTKGTFPVRYNLVEHYLAEEIPSFHWFVNENDDKDAIEDKKKFWLERRKKKWIFKEELRRYCLDDSLILAQICVRFCKEWITSQLQMQEIFSSNKTNKRKRKDSDSEDEELEYVPPYFFPFNEQFCTLGGIIELSLRVKSNIFIFLLFISIFLWTVSLF